MSWKPPSPKKWSIAKSSAAWPFGIGKCADRRKEARTKIGSGPKKNCAGSAWQPDTRSKRSEGALSSLRAGLVAQQHCSLRWDRPGGLSHLSEQCCCDRKSTRLNSSHLVISYAVFCLKKKNHM